MSRQLRNEQTPSEAQLWFWLKNRRLTESRFLRQHPIFFYGPSGNESFYIADFYCHEYHLVIEVDGERHRYRGAYDHNRTELLEGMGLTVLRFKNEEVLRDAEKVVHKVKKILDSEKLCAKKVTDL